MTMKAFLFGAAAALVIAGAANAKKPDPAPNPPTLHGFCAAAAPCLDNGTNTPTTVNPPEFGFSAGGSAATGEVFIDILVPNDIVAPGAYTLSGSLVGPSTFSATLVKPTAWTSGQLDSFLGISASPTNPVGAFLPSTLPFQPTATGFWVYQADIGNRTLPSNNGASDAALLATDRGLLKGSYVVAFIKQGSAYGATANSGAIFERGDFPHNDGIPEPSVWALMLSGFGLAGAALRRRRAAVAA